MKGKFKRGFTIVELVIVIAVIAVLSAVLIPTFANLIAKANVSADEVNAKNMTTVLQASGNTFNTIDEVKDYLAEKNYSRDPAPATYGTYYVWDRNANAIIIAENDGVNAKAVWPKNYVEENKTSASSGAEWYRLVDYVIDVTADQLTAEGGYNVTTFVPTLKLNANGAVSEAVRINGLANVDLTGHTLLNNFTIASTNRGGIYVDNGIINGIYTINIPNAALTHQTNLSVQAENAVINVADHSYYLKGDFFTFNLELKEVSHLVLEEKSTFAPVSVKIDDIATPTITVKVEIEVAGEVKAETKTITKAELVVDNVEQKTYKLVEKIDAVVENLEEKIEEDAQVVVQEVSTEAELRAALINGGNVKMLNDINLNARIDTFQPFVLDGDNHVLTVTGSDNRVFSIDKPAYNGSTYKFKNITIGAEGTTLQRGISLYNVENVTVNLDNAKVNAKYYAINIASLTQNINIVLNKCEVCGWAAINSYAIDSTYTVIDSILTGKNFTTNEAFGVIVLDGASLWKDDQSYIISNENSRNVVVNLINTKLVADFSRKRTGNYLFEFFVSLQHGQGLVKNDKIYLTNCQYEIKYYNDATNEVETAEATEQSDIMMFMNNCDSNSNKFYFNGREY